MCNQFKSNILSRLFGAVALAGFIGAVTAPQPAQAFIDEGGLFGGISWSKSRGSRSWSTKSPINTSISKKYRRGTILVKFSDRRLYLALGNGKAIGYPIAVPTAKAMWSGAHRISSKRVNPTWTPTPSMRKENPKLPAYVPGGHKRNPLGVRALYIGSTMYRIHGTDAPWLIGRSVSHGCIRMYNKHVVDLYSRVNVGAQVIITR